MLSFTHTRSLSDTHTLSLSLTHLWALDGCGVSPAVTSNAVHRRVKPDSALQCVCFRAVEFEKHSAKANTVQREREESTRPGGREREGRARLRGGVAVLGCGGVAVRGCGGVAVRGCGG
eukprot:3149708-Rhodomonas_salina.2